MAAATDNNVTISVIRPVNFEGGTGFEKKTLAEMRELALKYGTSHIVVQRASAAAQDRSVKPVHKGKEFFVYKMSDIPAAAGN